jgi:hypothetical protein
MNDKEVQTLIEQIGTLAEGVQAVLENQQRLAEQLDVQAQSLNAVGAIVGLTYLATDPSSPIPPEVLEDPAYQKFLDLYPLDGPPIIGKARMDEHLAQLEKMDPARLAAGFRELERQANLTVIERIRNRQIERIARQKHGDLEALERGSAKER